MDRLPSMNRSTIFDQRCGGHLPMFCRERQQDNWRLKALELDVINNVSMPEWHVFHYCFPVASCLAVAKTCWFHQLPQRCSAHITEVDDFLPTFCKHFVQSWAVAEKKTEQQSALHSKFVCWLSTDRPLYMPSSTLDVVLLPTVDSTKPNSPKSHMLASLLQNIFKIYGLRRFLLLLKNSATEAIKTFSLRDKLSQAISTVIEEKHLRNVQKQNWRWWLHGESKAVWWWYMFSFPE